MDVLLILAIYLLIVNLAGFAAMGIDKNRARRKAWRIPESTLFLLAIIGGIADAVEALESFMEPVIVSQVKPGEQRVRAALDLTSEGYKELAEQAGAVARTVTEARECGCGNLHPCGLADGSTLFADVEQGKPPEFRLAPW